MDKKQYDSLKKKYPKILKSELSCGNGWYWLLDMLCGQLQWDTDKNDAPQVVTSQVKEKYGGLRFYTNGETDEQSGSIRLAERMSEYICERCGSTESVKQTKGWIISLCPKCMKEYKKERGLK